MSELGNDARQRLEQIRARAEASMPGPLKVVCADDISVMGCSLFDGDDWAIAITHSDGERNLANAQFFAHAREDVLWLIGLISGEDIPLVARMSEDEEVV